MSIYDVNGNIISGGGGGGDSYIETNIKYRTVDIGQLSSGILNDNGTVSSNSNYKTSDYINIASETIYRAASFVSANLYKTACYDSQKSFLGLATLVAYNNDLRDKNNNRYYYCNFSLQSGTAFIRTCAYVDVTTIYISLDALENYFDINETYITVDRGEEIATAMGIPNLDFISRFSGKKMIAAGDSIVEKNSTASKNWVDWIKEWLGLTIYNDGQGGTGFAKNYYQRGSTIYRIENMWSSLYPTDPDIILVMGNQNDGTAGGGGYVDTYPEITYGYAPPIGTIADTGSTFSEHGIMRRLLTDLVTAYPKAKIGIISSTPRDNDITSQFPTNPKSYGLGWYHEYVEAQKEVCNDFGIPFLDLYHQNPVLRPYIVGNVAEYYADGSAETGEATGAVHPNNKGHLEGIARPVYEWMLGWM